VEVEIKIYHRVQLIQHPKQHINGWNNLDKIIQPRQNLNLINTLNENKVQNSFKDKCIFWMIILNKSLWCKIFNLFQ